MPAYDESANYGYNFNPEKSKSLLTEAGFSAQYPVPPITLVTTPDYLDLCKFVQSQLQEVGFSIELEVSPPAGSRVGGSPAAAAGARPAGTLKS